MRDGLFVGASQRESPGLFTPGFLYTIVTYSPALEFVKVFRFAAEHAARSKRYQNNGAIRIGFDPHGVADVDSERSSEFDRQNNAAKIVNASKNSGLLSHGMILQGSLLGTMPIQTSQRQYVVLKTCLRNRIS